MFISKLRINSQDIDIKEFDERKIIEGFGIDRMGVAAIPLDKIQVGNIVVYIGYETKYILFCSVTSDTQDFKDISLVDYYGNEYNLYNLYNKALLLGIKENEDMLYNNANNYRLSLFPNTENALVLSYRGA